MNKLAAWLSQATAYQKELMAQWANSSVAAIRLASKAYRTNGDINLTAEFAGRIEDAIRRVNCETVDGVYLPVVKREHLCKACATCPYQLACNSAPVTD